MSNDNSEEDELLRLREKRLREMEEMLHSCGHTPGVVREVTDMNIADLIQAHRYLVVDCWAEWCGPCIKIGPVIEELAGEFGGTIAFGKCDADMNRDVMRTYQISAIPTLLFFTDGSLSGRLTGAYPKDSIRSSMLRAFGL
ncbi:MAG: thioredoxin domain-containing protein [Methanogenium sp.]|jgi:thioredoxin 1